MVEILNVELGARRYPIHFGATQTLVVAEELRALQARGAKAVVVTDNHIAQLLSAELDAMAPGVRRVILPAGEDAKSLDSLGRILDELAAERVDRTGAVFAVGGGVIGDLAGFAAASYLRGIAFYQVPTTLLAMVDSSVGGKTGINLRAGKNLAGAFHQPRAVYIATDLLRTLPPRDFASGMAEVIKYGLLGDRGLFEQLTAQPLRVDSPELAAVIRRCCAAKAQIVEADEFETAKEGGRALLNLGHTFGHAIEQVAGYGTYLHGEAVAIGLVAAARLSEHLGLVGSDTTPAIVRVLETHQLPTRLTQPLPRADLLAATTRDKKVRGGRLRFVVLRAIGDAITRDDVDSEVVNGVWNEIGAR